MFEKEAEEYEIKVYGSCDTVKGIWGKIYHSDIYESYKDGAEFGYEQGIGRLRYCCTCKKWKECKVESMYGICADWEIKESE